MLEIFLHQLHDHLKSLRFQLSLVLLVAFFAANGLVYGWKAERLVDEVGRVEAESARRFDGVSDLGGMLRTSYRIHMRPLETGFMVEGGQDWSTDTVYLDIESGDGVARTGRVVAVNHWMGPLRDRRLGPDRAYRRLLPGHRPGLRHPLRGARKGHSGPAPHPPDLPGPDRRRQARGPPERAAGRRPRGRGPEPRHPGAAGRGAAQPPAPGPPGPVPAGHPVLRRLLPAPGHGRLGPGPHLGFGPGDASW